MRRLLKTILTQVVGKERVLSTIRALAWVTRQNARAVHWILLRAHWGIPPEPEWQDQLTTHYALWEMTGQPFLAERGAMVLSAIPQDAAVLELCCGDGYYTRYFHAGRAASVIAIDIEAAAIKFARKYHSAPHITYLVGDMRKDLPAGPFDTIIWNGAIEHFTPQEIADVMNELRARLKPNGIVSGYTIARIGDDKQLSHHEYEFVDKEDLLRFFTPHFKRAKVVESHWPAVKFSGGARHNLYFFASDGVLPFDADWPYAAANSYQGSSQPTADAATRPATVSN